MTNVMNRRKFLIRSAVASALPLLELSNPSISLAAFKRANASLTAQTPEAVTLSVNLWRTLDQLQQHLLPDDTGQPPSLTRATSPGARGGTAPQSSPGAKQINALNYLRGVLDDPKMDPANKRLIRDGVRNLQRFTLNATKKPFHRLNGIQKEKVLRELEQTPDGRRFLGKMMEYLLEALLAPPVYGGNTNQIGWKWLNHNPGFPLPPANKRYFLL
ncbi:MAG: hypothetical protein DSZ32_02280 [Gammaproteobacteria bacterium]|nr:MAG: hypothetical protein DSZ32_02280 [Gammaproteobacteria bacterium]